MPFKRAASRATPATRVPRTIRLLRFASSAVVALVVLFCATLLLIRYVAFPRIDAHRDDIAQALAHRIGQPVAIDAIVTGWDGWNPKLSIRGFKVGEAGHPVLELPRVDLVVAWTSLALLEPHLKELALEGPRLAIRRDPAGRLHVAGIEIDPERAPDDSGVTDWLLRQRQIVIHDGLVSWEDELRHAPQLVLDRVQLRVERVFGKHRFGLTGVPPAELSAPIDVRGEVSAASLKNWQDASGRVYVRLDYADVGAWQEWLPLPFTLDSGKGAVRIWFEFTHGQPHEVTADVELADVRARLAKDLQPVELAHVAGRIGGSRDRGHVELQMRALQFRPRDGADIAATDLTFTHDDASEAKAAHGTLVFNRLDLGAVSALAAHLPIPERIRTDLTRFAPRGSVQNAKLTWDGPADAPLTYQASASLENLAFTSQGAIPGASGITGKLDVDQVRGTFRLDSHGFMLLAPRVLAEPVKLDSASANARWESANGRLTVHVEDVRFANAQVAGKASATWRSLPEGPGEVDITAEVPRFDAVNVPHYLPVILHQRLRDWLRRAIVKGTATDARLTLRGDLARFPFATGGEDRFQIVLKAHGATLDYADGWPAMTDIDGEVRFDGRSVTVDASTGKVFGVTVARAQAQIADMTDPDRSLRIEGEASGPTSDFLTFVARSPVAGWIDHATDEIQSSGNGRLSLRVTLPFEAVDRVSLSGDYQIVDNDVRVPGLPPLGGVSGLMSFTEKELRGRDIVAEALGGTLKAQLASGSGGVRVSAAGTANAASLSSEFAVPLLDRMSGTTDFQFGLVTRAGSASWTVDSTLKGMAIDIPAPLGKRAEEATALHIERHELRSGEDQLSIDHAKSGRLIVHRRLTASGATVDRALLTLGRVNDRTPMPERNGVWVRGDIATLDADAWLAFYRSLPSREEPGKAAATLTLDGIDVQAATLHALGRDFSDLQVSGRRFGDEWRLNLAGREVDGGAVWRKPAPTQPNGRIVARLTRLIVPPSAESPASSSDSAAAGNATQAWPEIDLVADGFESHGHALGKLELVAAPKASDWQINKLSLANDAGRIDAHGMWHVGRTQQTQLDVGLDVQDAAGFLARFKLADTVKGAPTKIEGQLSWTGAPSDFDYPTLNGMFRVTTGPGQFVKADPGVGRLLGVLSLQALPRRVSLDFRDIFSEGFSFDSLGGNIRIRNGVMQTDDLHMVGPAAVIDISGEADLARETQQLRVKVQPSLSSSISAGAAALFIANPLIGAAVGAGTLLAQKILNNPLEQLFSYEYVVSGAWDDPVVERAARRVSVLSGGQR